MLWVWLRSAGQLGGPEIQCVSTKKRIKTPTEIVCMICSFLIYWAGMLNDGLKQQVVQGAEAVKMAALLFLKQDVQSQTNDDRQLIPFAG